MDATRRGLMGGILGLAGLIVARPGLARPPSAVPLFDFTIAGGAFHGLYEALPGLVPGMRVLIVAEPENRFDANAVAVLRPDGLRLGYVPRAANPPVAALLAQGRQLGARLTAWLDRAAWDDTTLAQTSFRPGDPRWSLELQR
ncbi:HIRAN domain-containing protein [Sediminicoccus sp. KRV36]|uniref:HIRAN domain-containing protein n=1 Tax=Sediminicoccus sp. KRV36 TaxID=3133721 RepID=UPI00200E5815|nr:HIRAN domain-containing protein [Sediminicoccus rosea]UPY36259.1 HIRAN domain-containing protein [Sediminicoccus rosea]